MRRSTPVALTPHASRLTPHASSDLRARWGRLSVVCVALLAILVLALVIGAGLGSVPIAPETVLGILWNKLSPWPVAATWPSSQETILLQLRLPRVLGGALIGAGLAVAGVLYQGLLRNPLADPYVIGVSSGAALGATVALLLPTSFWFAGLGAVPVLAFVGAILAVVLVYQIASVGGRTPTVNLLLAGFAVSALLFAAMRFLQTWNDRLATQLRSAVSFLTGSVAVNGWASLAVVAPLIVGGCVLAYAFVHTLNALALGEEGAAQVGVDVGRQKLWLIALGSLLTAAAVTLGGLIGFVGLVVPHAVRLVLGPDHRLLLPASALAGATFLVIADTLARWLLAPAEMPVGVLTALVGGPLFIWLLRHNQRGRG